MPATLINAASQECKHVQGEMRSRYSGYPLKDNEMVVTLLSWDWSYFGHSLIVFEWKHTDTKGNGKQWRKHKLFHLFPDSEHRINPSDPTTWRGVIMDVPGKVFRGDTFALGQDKPASWDTNMKMEKSNKDFHFIANVAKKKKVYFKSWAVDWSAGHAAFTKAKQDFQNPPKFNILNASGFSCAGWAKEIMSLAGITDTGAYKVGWSPVPALEVWDGKEFKVEQDCYHYDNV